MIQKQVMTDNFEEILKANSIEEKGCLVWTGKLNNEGYGTFYSKYLKKTILIHRKSYELNFGEIPKGLMICHKCNNKKCFKPEHLYAGTHKDNSRDLVNSGLIKRKHKRQKRSQTNLKVSIFAKEFLLNVIYVLYGFEKRDPEREYNFMYRVYGELLENKPIKKRVLFKEYNL